jgi:hypothetical protein
MAYEAIVNRDDVYRIVVEDQRGGRTLVNLFYKDTSTIPEEDWDYEDMTEAKQFCERKYGVRFDDWKEIPDS